MPKAVTTLLVLLLMFPPGTFAEAEERPIPVAAQTGTGPTQSVWDRVDGLPPDTRLKLVFTNGTEVTGTVVDARSDSVVLRDNQPGKSGLRTKDAVSLRGNVNFARSEVADAVVVSMPKRYVAAGETNIAAVRHVVTALGAGSKVDVNVGNDRFRGTIQSIQPDSVMIVRGSSAADRVAYQDVREIKPATMRGSTKALIIAGAAVGAMMLAYGASLSCGC